MAPTMAKEKPGSSGHNAAVLARLRAMCGPGRVFEGQNFADLSTQHIQKMVDAHYLSVDDLLTHYSRKLKDVK